MAICPISPRVSVAEAIAGHIVLVGLPGSGKSTIGPLLAAHLARPYLDFDLEIARRERLTVAQLFAERGEMAFRELERALTREVSAREGMVLSPGGGWIIDSETVRLLCPPAQLVYLEISPESAVQRMGRAAGARPLLAGGNPIGILRDILAARRRAYESAHVVVSVEDVQAQEVAGKILVAIASHVARNPGSGASGS